MIGGAREGADDEAHLSYLRYSCRLGRDSPVEEPRVVDGSTPMRAPGPTNRNHSTANLCSVAPARSVHRQPAGLRVLALRLCTWKIDHMDSGESLMRRVLDIKVD